MYCKYKDSSPIIDNGMNHPSACSLKRRLDGKLKSNFEWPHA